MGRVKKNIKKPYRYTTSYYRTFNKYLKKNYAKPTSQMPDNRHVSSQQISVSETVQNLENVEALPKQHPQNDVRIFICYTHIFIKISVCIWTYVVYSS